MRHGVGRRGAVLVRGDKARELPHPARRAGGQAPKDAEPALLAAGTPALYVREGRLGPPGNVGLRCSLDFHWEEVCADEPRALYLRGDPYETTDAVFGVKQSLIVDLGKVDAETAKTYGVKEGMTFLKHDFVLVTNEETEKLRDKNAVEALEKLGLRMKLVDHLPVPDVD